MWTVFQKDRIGTVRWNKPIIPKRERKYLFCNQNVAEDEIDFYKIVIFI